MANNALGIKPPVHKYKKGFSLTLWLFVWVGIAITILQITTDGNDREQTLTWWLAPVEILIALRLVVYLVQGKYVNPNWKAKQEAGK